MSENIRRYMELVEVTPIQRMQIGASLEIGAVRSLLEGLQYHRYAASRLISEVNDAYSTFYAEWRPNHSDVLHRYLIRIERDDVYVGYWPYDGRRPRLYGIHHRKQDVVKFLHKTYSATTLQLPELTLLTELSVPNITFAMSEEHDRTVITHKQGTFFTRSIHGEFTTFPSTEMKVVKRENTPLGDTWWVTVEYCGQEFREQGHTLKVATEKARAYALQCTPSDFNQTNPRFPWYMFQGALGFVELFEGKMFCYPDGSIRFLSKDAVYVGCIEDWKEYRAEDGHVQPVVFRGYTDLRIVQGDLVAYQLEGKVLPDPCPEGVSEYDVDRHHVTADKLCLLESDLGRLWVGEDCTLTITHPEHGETKYEAQKGEMLALLPGTSRPFAKDGGRD